MKFFYLDFQDDLYLASATRGLTILLNNNPNDYIHFRELIPKLRELFNKYCS